MGGAAFGGRAAGVMQLSYERITVHTANPFVIARGGASAYTRVVVTLTDASRGSSLVRVPAGTANAGR